MYNTVWHEHYFSAQCVDEVHGRFDAVEDDAGRIFVLDVGLANDLQAPGDFFALKRCRSRKEARDVAHQAARAYRASSFIRNAARSPWRKRLLRVGVYCAYGIVIVVKTVADMVVWNK